MKTRIVKETAQNGRQRFYVEDQHWVFIIPYWDRPNKIRHSLKVFWNIHDSKEDAELWIERRNEQQNQHEKYLAGKKIVKVEVVG